jgi:hypothetical protein
MFSLDLEASDSSEQNVSDDSGLWADGDEAPTLWPWTFWVDLAFHALLLIVALIAILRP